MDLSTLQTLFIDGDGVLWHTDTPVPGLTHFFDVINARGIRYALLTNNSSRTAEHYAAKMTSFGVPFSPDLVFTSGTVSAAYLRQHFPPPASVYVIGEMGLLETLWKAGYRLYNGTNDQAPEKVDAVVVGIDRDLNWGKLSAAHILIKRGAAFIGTNPDPNVPSPDGILPGAGCILAALQASTGVSPIVMGKPERGIYEEAMIAFDATPSTTAMLGDRLETDILGGQRAGIGTILVLTGVTSRERLNGHNIKPDLVFDDISALALEIERVRS